MKIYRKKINFLIKDDCKLVGLFSGLSIGLPLKFLLSVFGCGQADWGVKHLPGTVNESLKA